MVPGTITTTFRQASVSATGSDVASVSRSGGNCPPPPGPWSSRVVAAASHRYVLQTRGPSQVVRKGWYTRCAKDSDTGPRGAPRAHTLRLEEGGVSQPGDPQSQTLPAPDPKEAEDLGKGLLKVTVERILSSSHKKEPQPLKVWGALPRGGRRAHPGL